MESVSVKPVDWLGNDILIVTIVFLTIAFLLKLNWNRLKTRFRDWKITRAIDQIGLDQIRDWTCTDGLGGRFTIDRLILLKDRILVINYKPYVGLIYCSESIDEWTQIIDQRSFKFPNPLYDLSHHISTVKNISGAPLIDGYLLFGPMAQFPKGHPVTLFTADNIPNHLNEDDHVPANKALLSAWRKLKDYEADDLTENQVAHKT